MTFTKQQVAKMGRQIDSLYRMYCEGKGDVYDNEGWPAAEYVAYIGGHSETLTRWRTNWDEGGYADLIVAIQLETLDVKSIVLYFDSAMAIIHD